MTRMIGDIVLIAVEAPTTCEVCGQVVETRPYGPGGIRICHPCAMKPEYKPHVEAAFKKMLRGGGEP